MRHILMFGGLALACLAVNPAVSSAESSTTSYYAEPATSEEPAAEEQETSLLVDPNAMGDCSCDCDCECYDCCDCFNGRQRFLGMLPSDHCFDDFVSPISNPFFFEDPRSLTEVRGVFFNNNLPQFISGGNAQVWAAQLRGRVTDRVSIIVPRLGYLHVEQDFDPPQGFLSAPVGFKYNFIRDAERQLLVSGGITYFIKGSSGALSNFGDGDFHFYLTGGKQILGRGHWLSGAGFRIPADNNWGTQLFYWSNQWDYEVVDGIYPLLGLNWFHYMSDAGLNAGSPVGALDIINLPSQGVAGDNIVSGVVGLKWKPGPHCEVGTGYEFPMSSTTDILNNRVYADLIFRY